MPTPVNDPTVYIRRRRLPHWTLGGAVCFVTFRLRVGCLNPAERMIVRDHVLSGDGRFYRLIAVVVMPDHVHLLLQPASGYTLSRVMHGLKGVSARLVNAARGTTGPLWQDES